MYLVLLFAAAALLRDCRSATVAVDKHMRLIDLDNTIEPIEPRKAVTRRFVTIIHKPDPLYEHQQGDTLHLVCEGLGSPAPSVRWFKNDEPIYEYDMDSNEVIDSNPYSVARVKSTLFVSRSAERDQYTCLVTAGAKTARAVSVVYSKDGSTDLSERSKLYPLIPRVVVWYKVYVDTIGNDVVLPCRAKGHPRPRVTWRDKDGNLVNNNTRMKILRSGELVISPLRWSDMGEFSCHATNVFGTASAKTFVYPAKES